MQPGRANVVMASHLPLNRTTPTVRFFRGVQAVRKQLSGAEDLIGYTLRAKPLARDDWTLSGRSTSLLACTSAVVLPAPAVAITNTAG